MVTFTAAPTTFATDKMDMGLSGAGESQTFLIYDDSAVLTTWLASATDAQKTAVGSYSDGYAIQMAATRAYASANATNKKIGGCIGGTKDTVSFASCAYYTITGTIGTDATAPPSYATATAASQTEGATFAVGGAAAFTAATVTDDAYLGFSKTWKCSTVTPAADTAYTFTCNRFQVTEAASAAGDLRLDSTTTGGVITAISADVLANVTPATWKSAATLTLSAAAAVVAAAAF